VYTQELALKDSIVSKLMLNLLLKAVLSLDGAEQKQKQADMKQHMQREILTMLGQGKSSDLIGAVVPVSCKL
jgi:hypothetical protein